MTAEKRPACADAQRAFQNKMRSNTHEHKKTINLLVPLSDQFLVVHLEVCSDLIPISLLVRGRRVG